MIANRQWYVAALVVALMGMGCGDTASSESTSPSAEGGETSEGGEEDGNSLPEENPDVSEEAEVDGTSEEDAGSEGDVTDPVDSTESADGVEESDTSEPEPSLVERIPLGTKGTVHGVFTVSPTLTYAVGEGGSLLRFNGVAWSPMDSGT